MCRRFLYRYNYDMEKKYILETKKALSELEAIRTGKSERLRELHRYEGVSLRASSGRKGSYYYVRRPGESSYSYLGGDSNCEVQGIREYVYLKRLIKDIDSEIRLLRTLQQNHLDIERAAVLSRLPKLYREPSQTAYLPKQDERALRWKEKKEAEKSRYDVRNPDRLIMKAVDGTPMRSKSEVIIANLLISNGIPFVYELPHKVNGVLIYTDFTALSTIDWESEIMIEHEGMMTHQNYQIGFLNKVNTYLAADFIPGRDIFFTFDDLRGGFDPSPIQDIIDSRLKDRSQ